MTEDDEEAGEGVTVKTEETEYVERETCESTCVGEIGDADMDAPADSARMAATAEAAFGASTALPVDGLRCCRSLFVVRSEVVDGIASAVANSVGCGLCCCCWDRFTTVGGSASPDAVTPSSVRGGIA
jgi:hypothetical protein